MELAATFWPLVARLAPGALLLRAWPLTGGVSARVTGLELRRPDGRLERWVVRQHGAANLVGNPQVAAQEFRLLGVLRAAGLAVPAPLHLYTGRLFGTPLLVCEWVDGQTELAPGEIPAGAVQLAAFLSRLHRLPLPPGLPGTLPGLPARPAVLDETLGEGRIRAALEARWPPPMNPPAFLHGDCWPGNLLWRSGRLAAVLDWEDAALGDPLREVANARLELLWAWGEAAMHDFTREYRLRSELDFRALPVWDLLAALRPAGRLAGWGLDPPTLARMQADHRRFVDQAVAAL